MRSESDTPLGERYLWIEGRVSPSSLKLVQAGLPTDRSPGSPICFVGFAYADLAIPKQFEIVFPRDKPHEGVHAACRVVAVTQQWGKPFSEIPHGWATICVMEFPAGIPDLIAQLPVVDAWHQNQAHVCICDENTWALLKKVAAD